MKPLCLLKFFPPLSRMNRSFRANKRKPNLPIRVCVCVFLIAHRHWRIVQKTFRWKLPVLMDIVAICRRIGWSGRRFSTMTLIMNCYKIAHISNATYNAHFQRQTCKRQRQVVDNVRMCVFAFRLVQRNQRRAISICVAHARSQLTAPEQYARRAFVDGSSAVSHSFGSGVQPCIMVWVRCARVQPAV